MLFVEHPLGRQKPVGALRLRLSLPPSVKDAQLGFDIEDRMKQPLPLVQVARGKFDGLSKEGILARHVGHFFFFLSFFPFFYCWLLLGCSLVRCCAVGWLFAWLLCLINFIFTDS